VLNPHRRSAYYGGIRNGKTLGGCARTLLFADLWPGNVLLVGRKTYPQLRDTTWRELIQMVRKRNGGTLEPGPYVARYRESPMLDLELRNGSVIMGRYADNIESVLSMTLGGVFLDQAEYIDESIFTHLDTRLMLWTPARIKAARERHQQLYGQPMQGNPRGFIWITGNPRPGWVHRRFKLQIDDQGNPYPPGEYVLYEASTEENEANLPPGYLEELKRTQTPSFIQRYIRGDWTAFEGQVYSTYEPRIHDVSAKKLPWSIPPAHWPRTIGMDHGQRNPTAAVILAQDEKGFVLCYREYYAVSPIIEDHARAILAMCERDHVPRPPDGNGVLVHLDPAVRGDYTPQGMDFGELYGKLGIHMLPTNKNVLAGIQRVSELLHPDPKRPFPAWHPRKGQFGAPRMFFVQENVPNLLHELPLYEWEPQKEDEKRVLRERPLKYMDHALDALRYAVMGMTERAKTQHESKRPTYEQYILARMLDE
jgi:hypothetical protein